MQDEEERYVLTEKGMAWLAMYETGFIRTNWDDENFSSFWDKFELFRAKRRIAELEEIHGDIQASNG